IGPIADVSRGRVHRQREPCGTAGDQRALRVHERTAADRPAADGTSVRRNDAAPRGRRVRARHGMVEAGAADIKPPLTLSSADWANWPDEKLLELRLCDLGLTIEGTDLEARIAQIDAELAAR